MEIHTTSSGETWDSIAFKIYGAEKFAGQLMEANIEYLNVVVFSAGIKLNVPEIPVSEQEIFNLPPWRS